MTGINCTGEKIVSEVGALSDSAAYTQDQTQAPYGVWFECLWKNHKVGIAGHTVVHIPILLTIFNLLGILS